MIGDMALRSILTLLVLSLGLVVFLISFRLALISWLLVMDILILNSYSDTRSHSRKGFMLTYILLSTLLFVMIVFFPPTNMFQSLMMVISLSVLTSVMLTQNRKQTKSNEKESKK